MTLPEAAVIGAADEELAQLVRSGDVARRQRGGDVSEEALLEAAFKRLAAEAEEQQEAVARGRIRDTSEKRNRRDTYLNPAMRRKWVGRTKEFLERRHAALQELPLSTLYSTLVLQHLLELDIADQSLPATERRFEDSCTDGISDQFLLDAPRGRYTVDGEVFHYAETEGEAQKDFVARFVAALRRTTPPELTPLASGLMCQSALAALERATLCAAAVCGGTQDVDYSLLRDPARPEERVLVRMQVHRHGFREYLTGMDADLDEGPRSSDKGSSLLKSATVALGVGGLLDVVELIEQVNILEKGEPVPLDVLCLPLPDFKAKESCQGGSGEAPRARRGLRRALACLEGCIQRCQRCRRQARQPEVRAAAASAE